jgi:hypothetical protein
MYEIKLVLISTYGEFRGRPAILSLEDYARLVEMTKTFYSGGFELTLEDGTFVVFAPDVVSQSILKIEKKEIKNV